MCWTWPRGSRAPAGDPLASALKRQWDGIALNLEEAAEKMPEDKYPSRPWPDVKTFAGEVGHGANTHYFLCARIKGEPNPNKEDYEKATSKDVLVKALIASNEYCSSVLNAANGEWLIEMAGVIPPLTARAQAQRRRRRRALLRAPEWRPLSRLIRTPASG